MTAEHDCAGDTAAYVLGALEPAEAEAFRKHLESCLVCRDEVDELARVVQSLSMTAPQHPAPAALRRRVLRAVRAEPKSGVSRRRPALKLAWGRRPAQALAAAALAGAIVIAAALAVASGPNTRVIQARVSGISGTARLEVADQRGELIVRDLSPPPAGQVYEVWLKPPRSAPVPAGALFSVTSAGSADLKLLTSLRGIRDVMVTAEPDGGSRVPTHTPVIFARLR